MRERGRWPPWLGCNLVWISIKNIIFLHFACVRPFFPLSLDLGDFSFHLCAPLFKLRTPPLFCFCLDSHVIFSHLGSSIHMWFFLILARPVHFVSSSAGCQFFGFPAAPVSPVFVSCLGPHCSQDRFGFVFLPLSTVRDLFSSRSYFNFFGPHLRSIASRPLSVLFDFMFFSRACRALPGLVVTCALLFLVRFSFSWVENGGLSSLLARTQLAFFGWVAGVASSTSIFSVFVISDFVGIVVGWSRCHF
jgi:hypothetical protein